MGESWIEYEFIVILQGVSLTVDRREEADKMTVVEGDMHQSSIFLGLPSHTANDHSTFIQLE